MEQGDEYMNYVRLSVETMYDHCTQKNKRYSHKILKLLKNISNNLLAYKGEVPPLGSVFVNSVKLLVLSTIVVGSLGCSSIEKSSLLGLTVGAGIGAIAEQGLDSNADKKSTTKSSIIGAVVGLSASYLLHKVINKREDKVRKETLFNLEAHGISQGFKPVVDSKYGNFVTNPHVKEDYIETHTTDDGRVLIQGHKRWVLIGRPQFNLPKPIKD